MFYLILFDSLQAHNERGPGGPCGPSKRGAAGCLQEALQRHDIHSNSYFNIVVIFSSVLWLAVSVDFVHGRPAAHMVLAVLAVLAALTICRRHVRSKDILIISLNFS